MARSDDDLGGMLADLETDLVERKESASATDKIAQAICAYANDLPGYHTSGVVFVGATDDGRPSGLAVTDEILLKLANIRDTGKILPLPQMRVGRLDVDGQHVAVIEVEPSASPPVRYEGRVWIRVGPRRAIASADEERRLSERRRAADLTFDARPMTGLALDELDLALFEREYLPASLPADVIEENARTPIERLSALRLAAVDGTPTAAGVLLLGIDPTRHLPGAYLQFLRIDGTNLDDPVLDEKMLTGPVPTLLRQLDELLSLNIHTAVTIGTGATDSRRPDYPLAALQQFVRNAVQHRNYEGTASPTRLTWYEDRVELFSPGGPYGTVTVENFGRPGVTDYRNPVLAEAMRNLGYVQRFGAGLQIARAAAERNGNPPVEFDVDASYIGLTLRSTP
ncbi:MAG: putative DNA binding domain-containing protein [Actinobacteria bacterium]|nr:putative DNA binding domain-containing protein [Actinomycetota bacterium]